jgi:protein-L-isoaspartate(D-aspartate) O-methyltransferase
VDAGEDTMSTLQQDQFEALRRQMVEQITLHARLVGERTGRAELTESVMAIMGQVPRHEFVPVELRQFAYLDTPLPIGYEKTISQPFIVALMTDLLELESTDRVLEVGTGLGYQAAVLATLSSQVFSVELIEELARGAQRRLRDIGYENIELKTGDGSVGWVEHAPFDKILVAAAPELVPTSLLNQLKPGGRMVVPAGIEDAQQLIVVTKSAQGQLNMEEILPVRFSALMTSN